MIELIEPETEYNLITLEIKHSDMQERTKEEYLRR